MPTASLSAPVHHPLLSSCATRDERSEEDQNKSTMGEREGTTLK